MSDAAQVRDELARLNGFFPVLPALGSRWAARRPWEGRTVALHLHLTTRTAALVQELVRGGGRWHCSPANPATTNPGVVAHLRALGVEVHADGTVEEGLDALVAADPFLFADVGFALAERLALAGRSPHAGIEITRSGVSRLRAAVPVFPVLNISDGRLKPAIESRHGVGEGLWQSYTALTGCHLAGRRVVVVGYGAVGTGVAHYARAGGATVAVVDIDPVRRLIAQYDGFHTPPLAEALGGAQVAVTATGSRHALPLEALGALPSGAVLINAGHAADEIALVELAEAATAERIGPQAVAYTFPDGRRLVALGGGSPLNIVTNSGSQEPVLLHFAVLGLGLEWLPARRLHPGEVTLPAEIERTAAELALGARR